jgi:hypothetical protein
MQELIGKVYHKFEMVSFEGHVEKTSHIAKVIPVMLFNYAFINCIAYSVPKDNVIMNYEGFEKNCMLLLLFKIVPHHLPGWT